jgi:two-component system LytT family response regulator
VNAIIAHEPDVVFLDVQMPNGDGFAVVNSVGPREMPAVVFVTAHDEHAVRAFEARAVDYLLKPVRKERLADALDRVRSRPVRSMADARRLAQALGDMPTRSYLLRLALRDGERVIPIHVDRIDWIQADRNDVWLHVAGHAHLLHVSIGSIAKRLDPAKFAQVNRSAVVRVDAVRDVRTRAHGDCDITLVDGTEIVWSRRFRVRAPDVLGERPRV